MTPQHFSAKWANTKRKESAASKEHFLDLCALVGSPTPGEADRDGEWFAFEKGLEKGGLAPSGGKKRQGFADVFLRGSFAWEYKGPGKNLDDAYDQLRMYRDALDNPPLMIVSDMDRFVVRTNFNDMPVEEFSFTSEGIGSDDGESVALLKAVFDDPYSLKPGRTREAITEEVATRFGLLAKGLRDRGEEPHQAAHFLMKLVFCLFAEDAGLLPRGLFGEMVGSAVEDPKHFPGWAHDLFGAMAEGGRRVNYKPIRHFNGGLFADDVALELTREKLGVRASAAKLDWGSVEPAVFGTLFERSLDPDKRSQLGAQYTGKDDILRVVEPVLMAPLRREWNRVRAEVEAEATTELSQDPSARTRAVNKIQRDAQEKLKSFADKVRSTRVLDPACGSGNFLYVSLSLLLDLEKEVSVFAGRYGRGTFFPEVGPHQVFGIERDPYAHELAQVSVWIGYLQWMNQNGFGSPPDPILGPMTNVVEMDAILRSGEEGYSEPEWPEADVVVGNPPFLGSRRMRPVLGDDYCDALSDVYAGRVEGLPDLVCYWFERARLLVEDGQLQRAGLIATQAIRNPANRKVLRNIKTSGDIFMAWQDEPWVLDGAAVRISMVGFDNGSEQEKTLDGGPVPAISARLRAGVDVTAARKLDENSRLSSQGMVMRGPFDLDARVAEQMLEAGGNPNGRPNSDVVRRRRNARDITQRSRDGYAVDFGINMPIEEAAGYELPFAFVGEHVYPKRQEARQALAREQWWIFWNPRPNLREALAPLRRYIVTPRVSKHRVFAWLDADIIPDTRLIAFAREDDYFFGVLHSWVHEIWALDSSQRHGVGNDPTYNDGDCFETFPLPWPPDEEPNNDTRLKEVAAAAQILVEQRDRWLNPEEMPETELKKRTLTNLYNDRPPWLKLAHARLDRAAFAAYGWNEGPEELSEEEILRRLLDLNLQRNGS